MVKPFPSSGPQKFDCEASWGTPVSLFDTHPLLAAVRQSIYEYRQLGALHFALEIAVHADPAAKPASWAIEANTHVNIVFGTHNIKKHAECRPVFHEDRTEWAGQIEVKAKGTQWVSLEKFLHTHFPAETCRPDAAILFDWWSVNGKTFNWASLPNELRDAILSFCVCKPREVLGKYRVGVSRKKPPRRHSGAHEIMNYLGRWKSLLSVSRQVRALILRLVLVGNDNDQSGFTIACSNARDLKDVIIRLGQFYQMIQPGSMPMTSRGHRLAQAYLQFPHQHPHLAQYATIRHGVRKLHLQFDFLEAMHFWKVSTAGFDEWRPKLFITCDVFHQLPNLDGIRVKLPDQWWRDYHLQPSPRLFRASKACPRTLHRFIYARMAEVLAPYKDIKVEHFIDNNEEQRFQQLLRQETQRLCFTLHDLQELYEDSEGGIELEESMKDFMDIAADSAGFTTSYGCPRLLDSQAMHDTSLASPPGIAEFFPPKCTCKIPCLYAFFDTNRTGATE